jgi:hypothetical protein
MPVFKTKAEQTRVAQTLVTQIQEMEQFLMQDIGGIKIKTIFNSNLSLFMRGDGTCDLSNFEKINVTLSAHDTLKVEVWKKTLEQRLEDFMAPFMEFFPGQPLTWHLCVKTGEQNRHQLYLGKFKTSNITSEECVIDTVSMRWKSAIIRLSDFLNTQNKEDAPQQWLFTTHNKLDSTFGIAGDLTTQSVPAPSLERAYKLYCMSKPLSGSTPSPTKKKADFVTKITSKVDYESVKKDAEEFQKTFKAHPNFPKEIKKLAENFSATINSFKAEHRAEYTFDFIKNTVVFESEDYGWISEEDKIISVQKREKANIIATELCAGIQSYLHAQHPKMGFGTLTMKTADRFKDDPPIWKWTLNIDGYKKNINFYNIETIEHAAFILNWADITTTYKYYIFKENNDDWDTYINKETRVITVKATNPRHAWVVGDVYNTYGKKANQNFLYEAVVIPDSYRYETQENTFSLSEKIYNN